MVICKDQSPPLAKTILIYLQNWPRFYDPSKIPMLSVKMGHLSHHFPYINWYLQLPPVQILSKFNEMMSFKPSEKKRVTFMSYFCCSYYKIGHGIFLTHQIMKVSMENLFLGLLLSNFYQHTQTKVSPLWKGLGRSYLHYSKNWLVLLYVPHGFVPKILIL